MAYVDLNPVRAKIVSDVIEAEHTSLQDRCLQVNEDPALPEEYLAPLAGGIACDATPATAKAPVTLQQYLDILTTASSVGDDDADKEPDLKRHWFERLSLFKRHQRVYGFADQMAEWAASRGWSRPGLPFESRSFRLLFGTNRSEITYQN